MPTSKLTRPDPVAECLADDFGRHPDRHGLVCSSRLRPRDQHPYLGASTAPTRVCVVRLSAACDVSFPLRGRLRRTSAHQRWGRPPTLSWRAAGSTDSHTHPLTWSQKWSHPLGFRGVQRGSAGRWSLRGRARQTLLDRPTETSKACNGETRSWVRIPPPPLVVVRGRSGSERSWPCHTRSTKSGW